MKLVTRDGKHSTEAVSYEIILDLELSSKHGFWSRVSDYVETLDTCTCEDSETCDKCRDYGFNNIVVALREGQEIELYQVSSEVLEDNEKVSEFLIKEIFVKDMGYKLINE